MSSWFRGGGRAPADDQLLSSNAPRSDGLPVSRPAASDSLPQPLEVAPQPPPPTTSPSSSQHHNIQIDHRKILRGIERVGLGLKDVAMLYWNDIFHTMLTMPAGRFLAIFFCVYVLEYLCFAMLYLTVSDCIVGANSFSLALWFSVRTATTIGYSTELQPNVTCTSINLLMTFQVISAALVDYCMMGLVFARFATPTARASTVKFSSTMALHQQENGTWALSFRLANVRKHSLLRPEASLFLVSPDSNGTTSLQFEEMHIAEHKSHMANLRLGVPTLITHVLTPDSPLFDLSIDMLQQRGMEMLVLLDAIDPMTSNNLSAHWSYAPHDMRINRRFGTLDTHDRRGNTMLNFAEFDNTIPSMMYPDLGLDVMALSLRTIRSLTPMALPSSHSPNVSSGGGGGGAIVVSNGGRGSNLPAEEDAGRLLDREWQLSALCEAVMRDPNAGSELRHLAAASSFRGPHSGSMRRASHQLQPPLQQQHLLDGGGMMSYQSSVTGGVGGGRDAGGTLSYQSSGTGGTPAGQRPGGTMSTASEAGSLPDYPSSSRMDFSSSGMETGGAPARWRSGGGV